MGVVVVIIVVVGMPRDTEVEPLCFPHLAVLSSGKEGNTPEGNPGVCVSLILEVTPSRR